jgi:hypothetical protein
MTLHQESPMSPDDELFRAAAVGGMIVAAIGAGFLFNIGAFIVGYGGSEGPPFGEILMLAGAVAFVSACIVIHGLAVNAPARAAIGASVQGLTALLVLVWWVGADVWGDTAHADKSVFAPAAVLVLDAVVLGWAVWRLTLRGDAEA